ncbi:hypothetical protein RD792_010976 [Penstemon davidsonii]|uniref:RING-type E3 ubiquitin transferase n=1 Tax=Penstemon davidsonii TaxID=160366 RepID=A0ABR0D3A8_9LAMI|nr:hypothetical protein RD792_010976 [Penstemon davidsonii]
MKFGETFTEYLQAHQDRFLDKCCHVEYKRLKKVLKNCRRCRGGLNGEDDASLSLCCQIESCPLCDQKFFTELTKEASDIAGCLSSKQATIEECRLLIEYAMMNSIAMRKILKKYDKVHCSANGRKFKSKLREEHMEILQSPWLIELGAFYININESNVGNSDEFFNPFTCDLSATEPILTLKLPDDFKLEYNLTCAICLELVFDPYALGCGHLFCKSCACTAADVMMFQGLKAASPQSKCPVCREVGVYVKATHMMELDMLLKKRCKEYWKERLVADRAEMVKQSKIYWDLQTKYMIGY